MFRFTLALVVSAAVLLLLLRLPHLAQPSAPGAGGDLPPLPPAESRPPGVLPSAKWLPESPRYQYARREAFRQMQDVGSRLDLSTTRLSRHGLYRASITQRPEPVSLHEFQSWQLRILTADGVPVPGATLNVSGGMPQHGHGLPTLPKVNAGPHDGDYRVDGLQFSMPGWWEIHLYVSKDRREDIVTFNLVLE